MKLSTWFSGTIAGRLAEVLIDPHMRLRRTVISLRFSANLMGKLVGPERYHLKLSASFGLRLEN